MNNSMEECNSTYSTVPFTVYRTVAKYQTAIKEGSPLPLYISSFSYYEVSSDSGEVKPILNKNIQPHGISVRTDVCAHRNCTFLPEISGHIWAKNDMVCITPENFEANTAVENYNQGDLVKINGVKREIKALMCYELPAGTELPDPFRLRVDNANHCTIYWDPSTSGSPPEITKCRVGGYLYFHSPALHALPWKVHCFKMEARAEPSDLIGAPPSDPGIALVSVLLKYMEYVESDDAHWLTLQTDNLPLLTSEGMTAPVREKLEEIKYNIVDWIDSYDWNEMVKFSDELDKILDERKLNRNNTAEETSGEHAPTLKAEDLAIRSEDAVASTETLKQPTWNVADQAEHKKESATTDACLCQAFETTHISDPAPETRLLWLHCAQVIKQSHLTGIAKFLQESKIAEVAVPPTDCICAQSSIYCAEVSSFHLPANMSELIVPICEKEYTFDMYCTNDVHTNDITVIRDETEEPEIVLCEIHWHSFDGNIANIPRYLAKVPRKYTHRAPKCTYKFQGKDRTCQKGTYHVSGRCHLHLEKSLAKAGLDDTP